MAQNSPKHDADIFVSLPQLLKKEYAAQYFHYAARKHKVNTILAGKHASKLRGRGLDFEEVRGYVKGDDIRKIDWKVTARTKTPHTRIYTEEKERPVMIIVDQTKSMFFGSVKRTKSVVAAELAAISAFRVLKEGDRVGGVVFADNGVDIIQPKRDRKNILYFLQKLVNRNRELEKSRPVEFESALKTTLQRVRNIVTHDYLVVMISDFQRYSPKVIKALVGLSQHNDLILAKVYDPMEKELPKTKFVAGNQTHQITVEGQHKKTGETYQAGYEGELGSFKDEMKKHRIPVFQINTVDELDDQLKEIFKYANAK